MNSEWTWKILKEILLTPNTGNTRCQLEFIWLRKVQVRQWNCHVISWKKDLISTILFCRTCTAFNAHVGQCSGRCIMHRTFLAITRQPLELESWSNPLRTCEVFLFQFKHVFKFGFRVFVGDVVSGVVCAFFGRGRLALGANPTSHFCGSSVFSSLFHDLRCFSLTAQLIASKKYFRTLP